MSSCKKCGNSIEVGIRFCTNCGTAAAPEEIGGDSIFCPSCGDKNKVGSEFCKRCGVQMLVIKKITPIDGIVGVEDPAKKASVHKKIDSKSKRLRRKNQIVALLGAVVVIVLACVFIIPVIGGSSGTNNYGLYVKDSQMYSMNLKNNEEIQVTSKLSIDSYVEENDYHFLGIDIGYYVDFSGDGKRIFYSDRMDENSGRSIYYQNLTVKEPESEKIDSNIQFYELDEKGENMVYLRIDNILYFRGLDNKTKIASDVLYFEATDDLSKVLYWTTGWDLYVYENGKSEKLGSQISYAPLYTEDFSAVYYTKNGSLYRQMGTEDKEKLASDGFTAFFVDEKGGLYYTKSEEATTKDGICYIKFSLYYDDGKNTELIAEDLVGNSVSVDDTGSVVITSVYTSFEGEKDEWRTAIVIYTSSDIAYIEYETLYNTPYIVPDGSAAYYLTDMTDDYTEGDLYCVAIEDGMIGEATLYDTGVSRDGLYDEVTDANESIYFKDVNDNSGDLYIGGKSVNYDVFIQGLELFGDVVVYYIDWDIDLKGGTLKMYEDGEKTPISHDVADFSVVNDEYLLYVCDYSDKYNEGTLYSYNKKELTKIADEVSALIHLSEDKKKGGY